MTLTHRLALAAMFAGAAAFAQSSTGSAGTTGTAPSGSPSTRSSTGYPTTDTSSTAAHPGEGMSARSPVAMSPTAVLSLLQQVDQDELRLAQMAQSKASSDKVKDYAKDMIKDHEALDRKVSDFAAQNKLTLSPAAIPSTQRTALKTMVQDTERRLTTATGSQFDVAYMQAMSQAHASVLADLDAALPGLKANSQDSKAYDLVKMARDKVEDHKKHADDVLRDLAKSNTATGGSGMQRGSSSSSGSDMGGSSAPSGSTGSTGTSSSPSGSTTGR
jgi:putative membrane protein